MNIQYSVYLSYFISLRVNFSFHPRCFRLSLFCSSRWATWVTAALVLCLVSWQHCKGPLHTCTLLHKCSGKFTCWHHVWKGPWVTVKITLIICQELVSFSVTLPSQLKRQHYDILHTQGCRRVFVYTWMYIHSIDIHNSIFICNFYAV